MEKLVLFVPHLDDESILAVKQVKEKKSFLRQPRRANTRWRV